MKILIKKQFNFNEADGDYSDEKEIEVEIEKIDDEILIRFENSGECLVIPIEVFFGIIS